MPLSDKARIEHLHAVIRGLGTATDTQQFLCSIVAASTELTNSEAASILDFDDTASALRFVSASLPHDEQLRNLNVPLDGSIAGWVFYNAQPLIVHNAATEPRHFKAIDQITGFSTRSLLAVPLTYLGSTIGVLEVVNKKDNAHYTEEDVTLLEILSAYAAMVLWISLQESLRQATQNEIAELDKLKRDFIAITSHELRTPLGLILGHATFLRETVGELHQEAIDVIIRNVTKLKEIVENLTSVKNVEAGAALVRQQTVSMSHIARDVAASFQDMANHKNITLSVDAIEKDLPVEADPNKIIIALSNLVRNAITFTDPGGHVTVSVGSESEYVKVVVEDNGIGIPEQDIIRVFDRFYQVESHLTRRHSGMGLGLSVAKAMIEMHGGRIWAESDEGQGSKFTFLLPVSIDPEDAGSVSPFTS